MSRSIFGSHDSFNPLAHSFLTIYILALCGKICREYLYTRDISPKRERTALSRRLASTVDRPRMRPSISESVNERVRKRGLRGVRWRAESRGTTQRRHAAENRRAFGTPHRAGLMSRSVRLTFFRAAGCPFDYEHRTSLERPSSSSLARSLVGTSRAPSSSLLFSLTLTYATSHPALARVPFSRSISPLGRQSPLHSGATVPPSSRSGCTTPFLSNVVDVPNWSYEILPASHIICRTFNKTVKLETRENRSKEFLKKKKTNPTFGERSRGYRISRRTFVVHRTSVRTSPDFNILARARARASLWQSRRHFASTYFYFRLMSRPSRCPSSLYVICLASATTESFDPTRDSARCTTSHIIHGLSITISQEKSAGGGELSYTPSLRVYYTFLLRVTERSFSAWMLPRCD